MPKEFTNKRHYIVTKTGYYMKGIAEFDHNIINSNVKGYICSGTKSGIKDVSKILQEYISK